MSKIHIIEPLGGYFQVIPVEGRVINKVTKLGIVIHEKRQEKSRIYQVLKAGPGLYNPLSGGRFEHGIEDGDLIYCNQHGPIGIVDIVSGKGVDDADSFLIGETDIFAVYARYEDAIEAGYIERDADIDERRESSKPRTE